MHTVQPKNDWENLSIAARASGVSQFVLDQFILANRDTMEVKTDDATAKPLFD